MMRGALHYTSVPVPVPHSTAARSGRTPDCLGRHGIHELAHREGVIAVEFVGLAFVWEQRSQA